jgi:tripartite-type tricarboxylate transporter receptor subunit TctC
MFKIFFNKCKYFGIHAVFSLDGKYSYKSIKNLMLLHIFYKYLHTSSVGRIFLRTIMKHIIAALLLVPVLAWAWQPPAGKPVTATVGFAPGSGNEVSFRIVAAQVERTNPKLSFVVQNKPGAGEIPGVNWFAQQPVNGTNLYIASQQGLFTATELWYPGQLRINPMDMEFVTTIAKSPLAVVANINSRINTPEQFIQLLKNPPAPVNVAIGATAHRIVLEYLMDSVKGDRKQVQAVLYKGPAQAVQDVAGNQAEFGIMPIAIARPLIDAGRVKAIAITSEQRLAQIPRVPLWKDHVPGLNVYAAWMIMLPPGTPAEQVHYYNKLFVPAINSPEAKKMFDDNLMFTVRSEQTPEGVRAYISRLQAQWMPYTRKITPN